ncbi:pilus assembly protein TadG-related protein [Granulicella rosea]|nr:pilus assembly protein TadG-related protein [Granulicella rosea]
MTILASMGMVVILGFMGLALDVGNVRYAKGKLQSAADAAAVAAAVEYPNCTGQTYCAAMQNAALSSLAENGITGASIVTNCSTASTSGVTLMLNTPPCLLGTSDPNRNKTNVLEVAVTEPQPLYFARVLGFGSFNISARSEAGKVSNGNCVYALDKTGGNAITVDALAAVNATCGMVDESSAWNALSCNVLAVLNAPHLSVVGGDQNFLCAVPKAPTTGIAMPSPADPLSYLTPPAATSCGTSKASPYTGAASQLTILLGSVTLNPGHYCGGIVVGPLANVTFNPGTYDLSSTNCGLLGTGLLGDGGLSIDLLSNVQGNGVTFYNRGPCGSITTLLSSVSLGAVNLSAPTTGQYAGILFYQDPQNTTPATLLGSLAVNTKLEGADYFPSALVNYAVSGQARYNMLVAKDIDFVLLTVGTNKQTTAFANDYTALPGGPPIGTWGVVE